MRKCGITLCWMRNSNEMLSIRITPYLLQTLTHYWGNVRNHLGFASVIMNRLLRLSLYVRNKINRKVTICCTNMAFVTVDWFFTIAWHILAHKQYIEQNWVIQWTKIQFAFMRWKPVGKTYTFAITVQRVSSWRQQYNVIYFEYDVWVDCTLTGCILPICVVSNSKWNNDDQTI